MTNHSGLGEGLRTTVSLQRAASQQRATFFAAPSSQDEVDSRVWGEVWEGVAASQGLGP